MRIAPALLLAPALALAQASFPTTFPNDAAALDPQALKQRLTGKTFTAKPVVGNEMRIEYQESYAFVNVGSNADSGKWRVEGSSVCVNWQKFPPSCSEARLAGDALYVKRASNGEILLLQPK